MPSVQGQAEEDGAWRVASRAAHKSCAQEADSLDAALEALASLALHDSQTVFDSPDQLHGELVTLTLLPRAKWQTLLNLEVIAVCSRHSLPVQSRR